MKRLLTSLLLCLLFIRIATASPCEKYKFDMEVHVALRGEVAVMWSINTQCSFNKEELQKNKFIVTILSFFDEVIIKDTTAVNFYSIDSELLKGHNAVVVGVKEYANPHHSIQSFFQLHHRQLPEMKRQLDSLNYYLVNGYFPNALSILYSINDREPVKKVIAEYNILFPRYYPYSKSRTYFNSYFDEHWSLKKMPYVTGLNSFVKAMNKLSKDDPKRSDGLRVYIKIDADNKIVSSFTTPESDKSRFDQLSYLLSFDNPHRNESEVLLIFDRSRNGKSFTIVNERALMDQKNKSFKKEYVPRGFLLY